MAARFAQARTLFEAYHRHLFQSKSVPLERSLSLLQPRVMSALQYAMGNWTGYTSDTIEKPKTPCFGEGKTKCLRVIWFILVFSEVPLPPCSYWEYCWLPAAGDRWSSSSFLSPRPAGVGGRLESSRVSESVLELARVATCSSTWKAWHPSDHQVLRLVTISKTVPIRFWHALTCWVNVAIFREKDILHPSTRTLVSLWCFLRIPGWFGLFLLLAVEQPNCFEPKKSAQFRVTVCFSP